MNRGRLVLIGLVVAITLTLPSVPAPGVGLVGTGAFVGTGVMPAALSGILCNKAVPSAVVVTITPASLLSSTGTLPYTVSTNPSLTVDVVRAASGSGSSPADPLVQYCLNLLATGTPIAGSPAGGYCEFAPSVGCVTFGWRVGPIGPATVVTYGPVSAPYWSFSVDFSPVTYVV